MKRGSKKIVKDEAGRHKMEPAEVGSEKTGSDDAGGFRVTSEMIGGNPNGIDSIRSLRIIAMALSALILVWLILHSILHII